MVPINNIPVDPSDWTQVFSACLGQSIAVQTACGELVVKNSRWNIDLSRGIITFGKTDYPLQFIGSESNVSHTWMWGWNNINGFREDILQFPQQLLELGRQWKLRPLTLKEFDLNDTYNGHTLSLAAIALSDRPFCYYRCVHGSGAVFVAFSGLPQRVFEPVGLEKFASITAQCIGQFYLDHRIFVKSFLNWNKTPFEETPTLITAHFPQTLYIQLECVENNHRIVQINTYPSAVQVN